jgi:hypothetical protein
MLAHPIVGIGAEPWAWLGWLALGAAAALIPERWPRGALLAALATVPSGAVAAAGSPLAAVCVCALFAVSLCRVGALAGEVLRARPAALRSALGAGFVGAWVALDAASRQLEWGGLDGLAPGPGLTRAGWGGLDAPMLISVAFPGLWAAAWGRWLTIRAAGGETQNAMATVAMVPVAAALALAVLPLAPVVLDGSPGRTLSLHPSTIAMVHRLDRPLMVTVLRGGAPRLPAREAVRALDRLVAGIQGRAHQQVSVQRLGREDSATLVRGLGAEVPAGDWAGVEIRALDRSELLLPLPEGPRVQEAVADVLWRLGRPPMGPAVLVGSGTPDLGAGRPPARTVAEPGAARDRQLRGASAVIVSPEGGTLTEPDLRAVDAYAMGGGPLVVLFDAEAGGATALTGPWGVLPSGSSSGGRARGSDEGWEAAGLGGLVVPDGGLLLSGPPGLVRPAAELDAGTVAVALEGKVPSAFPEAAQGGGSTRMFLTSSGVAAENPGLVARGLDWVLDAQELAALRPRHPRRAPGPTGLLIVLSLLPAALTLVGTRTGGEPRGPRPAGEER